MQKRKSNEMSTDLNRSLQSGFTPGVKVTHVSLDKRGTFVGSDLNRLLQSGFTRRVKVTHVSLDKRGTFVGSDLNRLLQSGFYCGHKKNPQSIRSRVWV